MQQSDGSSESFFSGLTAQNSKTEKSAKTFIDVFQLFSFKKYDFKQKFCIKWDINKIFACLSKINKSIEVFYRFFSSALKTKVGGPCEVCALAEERYAVTSQSQHGDNFIHRKKKKKNTQWLHPPIVADEQRPWAERSRASGHSRQAGHFWIRVVQKDAFLFLYQLKTLPSSFFYLMH